LGTPTFCLALFGWCAAVFGPIDWKLASSMLATVHTSIQPGFRSLYDPRKERCGDHRRYFVQPRRAFEHFGFLAWRPRHPVGPSTLVPREFEKLGVQISHKIDNVLPECRRRESPPRPHERQRKEYFPEPANNFVFSA
jgi:hypothetical protein